ncbi:MAG: cell division protein SepF [Actinomycetaceae bacterium]|nr:cell division protein SepF [Actinomycetaceae bacterium]
MSAFIEKLGWSKFNARQDQEDAFEDSYFDDYQNEVEPAPLAAIARIDQPKIVSRNEPYDLSRIVTVHPRGKSDTRQIGEAFREGVPVIVNLTHLDNKIAFRIVDFCVGLTFGLEGEIEYVTDQVLLLSPRSVKVQGGKTTSLSENAPL